MQSAIETSKNAIEVYKQGKYDEALSLYLEAAKLQLEDYSNQGDNKPNAIDSPLGTIFADGNLATCYFAIGNCYKNLNRYEEAIPYLYACLSIADHTSISLSRKKIEERIRLTEIYFTEETPLRPSSDYWMNIPQGRTGRLINSIDYLQIAGLYTDQFTSCIIVIIKSKTRISLSHLDHMYDPQESYLTHLVEEYTWTLHKNEECELVIVHKKLGKIMVERVEQFFDFVNNKSTHPLYKKIKQKKIEISDQKTAVKISFAKGMEFSETSFRPLNLLCHPNDREISTVRQVETVFYLSNRTVPNITRVLFNGLFWLAIEDHETSPFCNTAMVKEFVAAHSENDPYMKTSQQFVILLTKIMQANPQSVIVTPIKEMCPISAKHLCLHTTHYNFKKIFSQDLLETLQLYESDNTIHLKREDKLLIQKLRKALKSDSALIEVHKIIAELKEAKGVFQKELVGTISGFTDHYLSSQNSSRKLHQSTQACEKAKQLCQKAQQRFLKKEYDAAKNLYFEAFQLLAHSVNGNNDLLMKCSEYLGNCYYNLKDFNQSLRFFGIAKNLYTQYKPENTTAIERLEKMISRCHAAFNTPTENNDSVSTPN